MICPSHGYSPWLLFFLCYIRKSKTFARLLYAKRGCVSKVSKTASSEAPKNAEKLSVNMCFPFFRVRHSSLYNCKCVSQSNSLHILKVFSGFSLSLAPSLALAPSFLLWFHVQNCWVMDLVTQPPAVFKDHLRKLLSFDVLYERNTDTGIRTWSVILFGKNCKLVCCFFSIDLVLPLNFPVSKHFFFPDRIYINCTYSSAGMFQLFCFFLTVQCWSLYWLSLSALELVWILRRFFPQVVVVFWRSGWSLLELSL